jgi:hypothetical protein
MGEVTLDFLMDRLGMVEPGTALETYSSVKLTRAEGIPAHAAAGVRSRSCGTSVDACGDPTTRPS